MNKFCYSLIVTAQLFFGLSINLNAQFKGLDKDLKLKAASKLKKTVEKQVKPLTLDYTVSKIYYNPLKSINTLSLDIEFFGNNVGKSIKEKDCNLILEEIISLAKKKECKIIFPEDVIVSNNLNGSPQKKDLNEISPDEMILDIGPKTIEKIINIITKFDIHD